MALLMRMDQQERGGPIITRLNLPRSWDHRHCGLMVCDLVRHMARAYKVDEDDVWEWVNMERHHPTTDIQEPS